MPGFANVKNKAKSLWDRLNKPSEVSRLLRNTSASRAETLLPQVEKAVDGADSHLWQLNQFKGWGNINRVSGFLGKLDKANTQKGRLKTVMNDLTKLEQQKSHFVSRMGTQGALLGGTTGFMYSAFGSDDTNFWRIAGYTAGGAVAGRAFGRARGNALHRRVFPDANKLKDMRARSGELTTKLVGINNKVWAGR